MWFKEKWSVHWICLVEKVLRWRIIKKLYIMHTVILNDIASGSIWKWMAGALKQRAHFSAFVFCFIHTKWASRNVFVFHWNVALASTQHGKKKQSPTTPFDSLLKNGAVIISLIFITYLTLWKSESREFEKNRCTMVRSYKKVVHSKQRLNIVTISMSAGKRQAHYSKWMPSTWFKRKRRRERKKLHANDVTKQRAFDKCATCFQVYIKHNDTRSTKLTHKLENNN